MNLHIPHAFSPDLKKSSSVATSHIDAWHVIVLCLKLSFHAEDNASLRYRTDGQSIDSVVPQAYRSPNSAAGPAEAVMYSGRGQGAEHEHTEVNKNHF